MFHSLIPLTVCLSLLISLAIAQSLSLSITPKATDAPVSAPLSPSYAGFGIEPSNLFSFTGNDVTNQFSVQLLQNLADFAGNPPHIRLGGNTQDYFYYDPSFTVFGWKENPQSTGQGVIASDSMLIGPGYFGALERFPKNTPVTVGLNLALEHGDYIENLVTMAKAAVDGMSNTHLYSFELGNEPDLYLANQLRSGSWGGQQYTQDFLTRAAAIYEQALQPAGIPSKFFEPPCTASTIGTTFEIALLEQDGILDGLNGTKFVSMWNQHDYYYFIGVTDLPLTVSDLLNLDGTDEQFAYWAKQVEIALDTGYPYALREMSSVGPVGAHGVSDTFGAALWTLNFFLYAATLNISSVQMHMTDNSNASAWQPRAMYGRGTFVRPQYYAHAAVAQIIGSGNCTTQIGSADTEDATGDYKGRVRAYTAYAHGDIQAVILINAKEANASEDKGSYTFTLNLGKENANSDVYLSYLTADGADSLDGTTWNGMTFSNSDGSIGMVDESADVLRTSSSGVVSVPVRDSQAVVANLAWALGSQAVLTGGPLGPQATSNGAKKKSAAQSVKIVGAGLAAWKGVVTTTLVLASALFSQLSR